MAHYTDMKWMSMPLSRVFEGSGFSEFARQFQYNINPVTEVLMNSDYNIVGSYSEGTQIEGSDIDFLFIDRTDVKLCYIGNPRETRTYSDEPYLCLTREPSTPAGYTKLQIYWKYKCFNNNDINALGTFFNHEMYTCHQQNIFLTNRFLGDRDEYIYLNFKNQGPALTRKTNGNTIHDSVCAYESNFIPTGMKSWFERVRFKDWPSKTTCGLFKSIGCCYVGVGHSTSPEQFLEWRISPTRQELYLMLHLNPTQFRCYIVLKWIKKYFINKECGDGISSYHCKTTLFWTIENNERDIWQPDKLIDCVLKCLELLLVWVTDKRCPNYFIPNENMFETKLKIQIQIKKLKKCLRDLINVSLDIAIYDLFGFLMVHSENTSIVFSAIALKRAINLTNIIDDASLIAKHMSTTKQYIELIETNPRNSCLQEFQDRMFPYKIDINILLEMKKAKLASLNRYIHFKFVLESKTFSEKDIIAFINDMSNKSNIDLEYYLKLASVAATRGEYSFCDVILQKINGMARVNIICECIVNFRLDEPNRYIRGYRTNLVITNIGKKNKLTAESIQLSIRNVLRQFTFCLQFYDSEYRGGVLMTPLHFDAHKTVGIPSELMFRLRKCQREDLISIHPMVYMCFLQYKNSEMMNKKGDMFVALEKLEHINLVSLETAIYAHPDTILNLLGHIYMTKGWYRLAVQCYSKSWLKEPHYNALKWHAMFMLFSNLSIKK